MFTLPPHMRFYQIFVRGVKVVDIDVNVFVFCLELLTRLESFTYIDKVAYTRKLFGYCLVSAHPLTTV